MLSLIQGNHKKLLNPGGNYLLKANKRNTRTSCEICSYLTIKTPEWRHWRRSGVFIVNFEYISYFVLVFLLNMENADWVHSFTLFSAMITCLNLSSHFRIIGIDLFLTLWWYHNIRFYFSSSKITSSVYQDGILIQPIKFFNLCID